jgi:lipid A 3-O-deacylase
MSSGDAVPTPRPRSKILLRTLIVAASVLSWPGLAGAQESEGPRNFVSLYFENDTFRDTDQSYTNGVRVSWAGRLAIEEDRWYLPTRRLERWFWRDCDVDPTLCYEWWSGWVVGQSMYTPQDIRDPDIILDDRPYGGWLYLGPTFTAARPRQGELRAVEHSLQLMLGVLGSPSLAREAQTFVHEYIATSAPEPMGWDHQVATEPTVNVLYSGRQRQLEHHRNDGATRVFDVVTEWGFAAGNVFTYFTGGGTARLGWNLGEDFGAARVEPVVAMAGREHRWEAYLFGRLQTRYTLHNAFLDGGWLRRSVQTVSREAVVADVELGGTVRIPRVALSARWVRRTPEFDERRIYQEYGALSLTWFH